MNIILKFLNISIFVFILFALPGCKSIDGIFRDKDKAEIVEVDEKDKQKSTVLLIEASKEKMLKNWHKASSLYMQALEKDPQNAAAAHELGKIYAKDGEYSDALKYAKKAVDVEPENQFYLIELADIYYNMGKLEKTVETHQKIADLHPEKLSLQFDLLNTYIYIGKYDKALETIDHIESIKGFSDEISSKKIQLLMEMELYDEAIEETKELISLVPEKILYKDYLAEIYFQSGKKEKAIEIYYEIIEKDPENVIARLQLSEHYRQKDEMEKSFEHIKEAFKSPQLEVENKGRIMYSYFIISEEDPEYLKQAFELMDVLIEMYPEEAEIINIYGDFLFREEKYEQAREMFAKSTKLDPAQYQVWEQILYISSTLEEYDYMIEYSEKALEYFFERPALYFFNGLAHLKLENYNNAVQSFEFGVDFIIDNKQLKGQFYTLMGDSYYQLDDYENSDQSYEKALEINPENTFALNNYSYYLAKRNEQVEYAKEMSKKANQLEKNNAAYLDTYGWIMYKMGDYEEAKKWIEKAIENNGKESATILEHYGDVLYKLGHDEKSLKYWKKASEQNGDSELLEKKIKEGKLYE